MDLPPAQLPARFQHRFAAGDFTNVKSDESSQSMEPAEQARR